MDARDLFLSQHTAVHSVAVGGNAASAAERVFGGVTDEQMRVRPREDLNSLAWILWHIARGEDIFAKPTVWTVSSPAQRPSSRRDIPCFSTIASE